MVIALDDYWIWDSWYFRAGDRFHAFFLQAPKSLGDPDLRHWHASYGHATSRDLVHWEHHGTALTPSNGPAFDDRTIWTGSVLEAEGQYHLFYTGCSRAEPLVQRIGHAVSDDLHNWRRVSPEPCLDLTMPPYERTLAEANWRDRSLRDPWVMPDPDGGYLMFFTARVTGQDEPNEGAAIGLAHSSDLMRWRLLPPIFSGGFGQMEVPQVFAVGSRWYCLFCTSAEDWSSRLAAEGAPLSGAHYLISDTGPRGPWRLAPLPMLDGARPTRRYAQRVVFTGAGMRLMGFDDGGAGPFTGRVMDPVPLHVTEAGLLSL